MFNKTILPIVGLGFACLVAAAPPPGPSCDPNDPNACSGNFKCVTMTYHSMGIVSEGNFCILRKDETVENSKIPYSTPTQVISTLPPTVTPTPSEVPHGCTSEEPDEPEEPPRNEYPSCGGMISTHYACDAGLTCIDDPRDEFGCGMACDMLGICISDTIATCGGFEGLECPAGTTCYDHPKSGCDSKNGGSDCPGICL